MFYNFRSLVVLFISINLVFCKPIAEDDDTEGIPDGMLLPNTTRPIYYDIHIKTEVDRGITNFTGVIDIYFYAAVVVDRVYLHMKQLEITFMKLIVAAYGQEHSVSHSYDEEREFLIVHVAGGLFYGQTYKLTLEYKGNLRTDNAGFYIQSYKNSAGLDV